MHKHTVDVRDLIVINVTLVATETAYDLYGLHQLTNNYSSYDFVDVIMSLIALESR
jgi:hypothetical protein